MNRYWLAGATAVVLFLLTALGVASHGGGELAVGNAPVGEYKVSVWVNPPRPRANQVMHVTVGIAGENDAPVLDAHVAVTLLVTASGEVAAAAAATTAQSVNRLFYEADLPRVNNGGYDVQVTVSGANGQGVVSFPLVVRPSVGGYWALLGVIAVGITGGTLLIWSWRAQKQTPAARRARLRLIVGEA